MLHLICRPWKSLSKCFLYFWFFGFCFAGEVNGHNRVVVLMFLKRPLLYPNAPNHYSHKWAQLHETLFNLSKRIFLLIVYMKVPVIKLAFSYCFPNL